MSMGLLMVPETRRRIAQMSWMEQAYRDELNEILGEDVVQRVRFVHRGTVEDAVSFIDREQSFAQLYALSCGADYPGSVANDESSHEVLAAAQAADEMRRRLCLSDSMIAYMRGVEYWRSVQMERGETSIYELVLRRRVGDCPPDDVDGLMETISVIPYRIPLGMLRDEPGTFLVYCSN